MSESEQQKQDLATTEPEPKLEWPAPGAPWYAVTPDDVTALTEACGEGWYVIFVPVVDGIGMPMWGVGTDERHFMEFNLSDALQRARAVFGRAMKTSMRRAYMHLIEGRPARFDARRQELFWGSGHGRNPIPLCSSLAELKAQQEVVRQYHAARGWPALEFGYACVRAAIVGPDDQQTDCVGVASTVLPSGIGEGATHAGGESGLPHHDTAVLSEDERDVMFAIEQAGVDLEYATGICLDRWRDVLTAEWRSQCAPDPLAGAPVLAVNPASGTRADSRSTPDALTPSSLPSPGKPE